MKLNKPKHNLFKNTVYALEGFIDIVKNETSFKWQLLMLAVFGTIAWVIPISFESTSILFISLFIPIIAEVVNSAIERVVDLVTQDYHILAKQAKDVGATIVLLSFLVTVLIWSAVLISSFHIL